MELCGQILARRRRCGGSVSLIAVPWCARFKPDLELQAFLPCVGDKGNGSAPKNIASVELGQRLSHARPTPTGVDITNCRGQ